MAAFSNNFSNLCKLLDGLDCDVEYSIKRVVLGEEMVEEEGDLVDDKRRVDEDDDRNLVRNLVNGNPAKCNNNDERTSCSRYIIIFKEKKGRVSTTDDTNGTTNTQKCCKLPCIMYHELIQHSHTYLFDKYPKLKEALIVTTINNNNPIQTIQKLNSM